MRKILSVIMLLVISSSITFGQHVPQMPIKFTGIDNNASQNLDQYLVKNVNQTRAVIWSSNMATQSAWTYANDASATLATHWTWLSDTSQASTYFKQYVHSAAYMQSPTANNGVWYFDAITNLVNASYGVENSTLTNATPISTLGHNAVTLKFYQLYKSFNDDTTSVEISSDNVSWHRILVNPTITYGHANNYAYGQVQFNITPWAGNKSQVWIRFRFNAPATTASGPQYSGGYGWMVDDVSIEDAPNNRIEFSEIWAGFAGMANAQWSGYTSFPSGQVFPVTMQASFSNTGGLAQNNVYLNFKDLTNSKVGTSATIATIPVTQLDTLYADIDTIGGTIGTYKYTIWAHSDSVASSIYKDTLSIVVNDKTLGYYSRDNNYYNGYRRYNGVATTGSSVNAFQFANLVDVTTADAIWAKSISVVLGSGTTINAPIKGILYRGWGQTKTVIAESDYHFVQANEIATTVAANPPAIELFFNDYSAQKTKLQKDSSYFVALQAFGGSDTVWVAVGSSNIPQPDYAQYVYDTDNTWYYYSRGTSPPMIRLNTRTTDQVGIKENNPLNATLYQNMPNPATNSTRISYELKKSDNVTVDIYDFLGNKVKSFYEGRKSAGFYSIEVSLNGFASGTYFYTLKTDKNIATKKMVVVK